MGTFVSYVYPHGSERPIAYASRKILASEKKYAQVEKETLSLIFGITQFVLSKMALNNQELGQATHFSCNLILGSIWGLDE